MADDEESEEEDEAPAVELGAGESVAGAPLARVAHRLHWGMKRSEIRDREGDTEIRTPEGPKSLSELLDGVDVPYFESRQEFVDAVRAEAGLGPVD